MSISYFRIDLEDNIWDVWKISEGISSTLPIHSSFWKNRWWWQNILSNTHKKQLHLVVTRWQRVSHFGQFLLKRVLESFILDIFWRACLKASFLLRGENFTQSYSFYVKDQCWELHRKAVDIDHSYVSFHQFSEPNQTKYWEKQSFR